MTREHRRALRLAGELLAIGRLQAGLAGNLVDPRLGRRIDGEDVVLPRVAGHARLTENQRTVGAVHDVLLEPIAAAAQIRADAVQIDAGGTPRPASRGLCGLRRRS